MSKNLGDHPEIKQPTEVVPWFVLGNSHFSDPHQKNAGKIAVNIKQHKNID